ncbi:MAG TPA: YkgJ family cysteine cluster protein [Acidobacteriaceae bacterium]|nr:YkgJ family cysteine cluster protein [Acidobacteriaceae bacterium]
MSGVKATFSIPVGEGTLHCEAVVPEGPTTLTQLLPIIRNLESAIGARVAQEAESAGRPITCGPGCGACCRQLVPVSLFEAESLTNWMRTLTDEQQSLLQERFHRALLALREAGVIDKILSDEWIAGGEPVTQLAIDYFHAGVPCPFLENESCSIHPIRPLSCREYLVTSPPVLCQDPAAHPVAGLQFPLKLSRTLYNLGRQIEQDPRGWIPLVFLPAWGKSGFRPGEHVAGTGEELLRRFLEEAMGAPPQPEQ